MLHKAVFILGGDEGSNIHKINVQSNLWTLVQKFTNDPLKTLPQINTQKKLIFTGFCDFYFSVIVCRSAVSGCIGVV